jgi:thiol:disulfide interchange protein DsbD
MPAKTRAIASTLAVLITIGTVAIALSSVDTYAMNPGSTDAAYAGEGIEWESFTPDYLEQLKQEGKAVFLDFTAAWCLSCQVNERLAFSSEEVQNKFEELNIVALKADWTSRNETITKALASYGRNSVPLYVFYPGGNNQQPVILPEIITPGIVLDALETKNN